MHIQILYYIFDERAFIFAWISNNILKSDTDSNIVIFFTDGCDTSGINSKEIATLPKYFTDSIKKNNKYVMVHTLGLGNHDASFLNGLVTSGSVPGTYQYCSTISEIRQNITNITGFLNLKMNKITLCFSGEKIDIVSKDGSNYYIILDSFLEQTEFEIVSGEYIYKIEYPLVYKIFGLM